MLSKNARTGVLLLGVAAAMVGASFAAVPLYQLFCQVTGYGGTPNVAAAVPATAGERVIKIRFNSDVDRSLPWQFQPAQREIALKVGEQGLAFYAAKNTSDRAMTGVATFNVTPLKAGAYFSKVQCFCFDEQRLAAGEEVDMPVTFFVDPEINSDPNLDDVKTITLSYTFFRDPEDAEHEATESAEDETAALEQAIAVN